MLKGFKHAAQCQKCGEQYFKDSCEEAEAEEKKLSSCCNAKQFYAGLQPYVDKVLVFAPTVYATKVNENTMSFVAETVVEKVFKPISVKPVTVIAVSDNSEQSVKLGKRGKMTVTLMRDELRSALEQKNMEQVKFLETTYPQEFKDCLVYLPAKLTKLMQS